MDHAVRVLKGLGHRGIRWACPGGACLSHLCRTRLPRRRVGRRGLIRHNTIPSYVSFGLLVTLLGLGVGVRALAYSAERDFVVMRSPR